MRDYCEVDGAGRGQARKRLRYFPDDRTTEVRFSRAKKFFSSQVNVQSGARAQEASYRSGGSFPGTKRPGREVDHSHPSVPSLRMC
jgi:hypothetical protein